MQQQLESLLNDNRAERASINGGTVNDCSFRFFTYDAKMAYSWDMLSRIELANMSVWDPAQWSLTLTDIHSLSERDSELVTRLVLSHADPIPSAAWTKMNSASYLAKEWVVKPAGNALAIGAIAAMTPLIVVGSMVAGPFLLYESYSIFTHRH